MNDNEKTYEVMLLNKANRIMRVRKNLRLPLDRVDIGDALNFLCVGLSGACKCGRVIVTDEQTGHTLGDRIFTA